MYNKNNICVGRNNILGTTLKDIAEELNLSINTVSRALRDMPDIGKETTDLVKETAKKLGYRKNLSASRLRTNKSFTLGMIVADISNPIYAGIIKGVEKNCKNSNYTVMLGNSNEDPEEENNIVSSMLEHGVDGILLVPSMKNTQILSLLKRSKIPYVILQRKFPDIVTYCVQSNDRKGGQLAAEYLYTLGHRSFVYVAAPMHISSSKERYEGFLDFLREKHINSDAVQILESDGTRFGAYQVVKSWLKQHHDLHTLSATAIFCFSDYVACGVYSAFSKYGLQIPRDISVIGYDNNEYSNMMLPSLTTIDIRPFQLGKNAAELLLNLIDNPSQNIQIDERKLTLSPRLIIRKSVRELFQTDVSN